MPHEVRVLSWAQLLLCIRLRAGERGFICTDRNLVVPSEEFEVKHRKRACFDKVCERRNVQVTGIRISNANRAAFTIVRRSTIDALRSISRSPSSYRTSSRWNLATSFPLGTV